MAPNREGSFAPCDDGILLRMVAHLDGKSIIKYRETCLRFYSLLHESTDGAGVKVWRSLCQAYNYHQNGTRTRGRLAWSRVYQNNCCIECCEPGRVFINDPAGSWANGRFALCLNHCRHPEKLFRIARRPELSGNPTLLSHTLFRINTVRRELGFSSSCSKKKRKPHSPTSTSSYQSK